MATNAERVEFALRLNHEIDRANMRSIDLAHRTNIPLFVINRWRDAQGMPTPAAIDLIAKALGVPVMRFNLKP